MGLRHLLLVVPAAASLIAGYALLGPGARRDVASARFYAAATEDGAIRSGRVTLATKSLVGEKPRGGRVDIQIGLEHATVEVGPGGVAEVAFEQPVELGDHATVREGDQTIADAQLARPVDAEPHAIELGEWGSSTGELKIGVRVPRGPLVPTFASDVVIEIHDAAGAPVPATLDIDVVGAECAACAAPGKTAGLVASVVPSMDVVSITVDATAADGRKGHGYAELPARMGGVFLAASSTTDRLLLSAPNKRKHAFVSLFQGSARVGGAEVQLAEDERGIFAAELPIATPGVDVVVLTADAEEAGISTTWTLSPEASTAEPRPTSHARVTAPRLVKVLDGFPDLERREARRVGWVHKILFLTVGALGLLEILLLSLVARATRKDLTTHFEEARDGEDIVLRPAAPIQPVRSTALVVVTVGLVVVLASAALVGLAFVRG